MVQLWYGLYTKIYDTIWGDWGAGMLQRTGKGGADDTCGIGKFGDSADATDAKSAGNY